MKRLFVAFLLVLAAVTAEGQTPKPEKLVIVVGWQLKGEPPVGHMSFIPAPGFHVEVMREDETTIAIARTDGRGQVVLPPIGEPFRVRVTRVGRKPVLDPPGKGLHKPNEGEVIVRMYRSP